MNIDPQLLQSIPPKWLVYLLAAHAIAQLAGRVYTALAAAGGIKTILQTIYCGSAAAKKDNTNEKAPTT